jgi:predicted nuclease with TOPRIM domain
MPKTDSYLKIKEYVADLKSLNLTDKQARLCDRILSEADALREQLQLAGSETQTLRERLTVLESELEELRALLDRNPDFPGDVIGRLSDEGNADDP